MAQVRDGDAEAFSELYHRYRDRVQREVMAVCGDWGRAEDAAQDTFLSLWRSRETYEQRRGTVGSWVLSSARHRAIDVLRRDGRHRTRWVAESEAATWPAVEDMLEAAIERADAGRVRELLPNLPQVQAEVVALAYYGGLSQREIAARLSLPAGTVKGRMRLGLRKLRRGLGQPVLTDSVARRRGLRGQ